MARNSPIASLKQSLKYRFERFLVRGPLYRILVIWSLILVIAIQAGYDSVVLVTDEGLRDPDSAVSQAVATYCALEYALRGASPASRYSSPARWRS